MVLVCRSIVVNCEDLLENWSSLLQHSSWQQPCSHIFGHVFPQNSEHLRASIEPCARNWTTYTFFTIGAPVTFHKTRSCTNKIISPTMTPPMITSLGQIQPVALPFFCWFKKLQFVEERFGVVPIVAMWHGFTPNQPEIPVHDIRCNPTRCVMWVGHRRLLQSVRVAH